MLKFDRYDMDAATYQHVAWDYDSAEEPFRDIVKVMNRGKYTRPHRGSARSAVSLAAGTFLASAFLARADVCDNLPFDAQAAMIANCESQILQDHPGPEGERIIRELQKQRELERRIHRLEIERREDEEDRRSPDE